MATTNRSDTPQEASERMHLIAEYQTYRGICEDKHGYQAPAAEQDSLDSLDLQSLRTIVKRLVALARTPHSD